MAIDVRFPSSALSNNPFTKDKLIAATRELGEHAHKGVQSRGDFAILVATYAAHGAIDHNKPRRGEPDDVEEAWSAFQEARRAAKRNGIADFVRGGDDDTGGRDTAQRVSKLRQCAIVGPIPGIDGVDVLKRARAIAQATGDLKCGTYGAIIDVARAQKERPRPSLTDEEIREAPTFMSSERDESERDACPLA